MPRQGGPSGGGGSGSPRQALLHEFTLGHSSATDWRTQVLLRDAFLGPGVIVCRRVPDFRANRALS